jgi:superfamily II RNA helicase
MPARTVVFNSIFKFDGKRLGPIKTREHHQMSGRAGRRGIDEVGYVYSVVEWPHIRASDVERVIHGEIEPIRSQFNLSYATLLTLWEHLGNRSTRRRRSPSRTSIRGAAARSCSRAR